nr:hypothetical protein [Tanacetum cinerariifolium]
THKLKRLYKVGLSARVESSNDNKDLGEDASKQRRKIHDIGADENITLVDDQDDRKMFDADKDLQGEEIRGTVIREHKEPSESKTTTTISSKKSQDKGKAKMIEELMKPKKKDQILLDEVAKKQQDKINEEERLTGERARLAGERAQ